MDRIKMEKLNFLYPDHPIILLFFFSSGEPKISSCTKV